jgi:hypothetical protein
VPRLILILAIGLAAWIIYTRITAMPATQRKAAYLKVGLAALVLVVVIGVATGRMHWLGAAITGLLVGASRLAPTLMRLFPVFQWLHKQHNQTAGSSGGGSSEVETSLLKMTLDHASGNLDGEVLQGEFAGRRLDDLDRGQLDSLLAFCCQQDVDSARLLESYLQRRFGDSFEGSQSQAPESSGQMTENEALAVLGLESDASREQIIEAHRRLMQKLHPDRGGNDYLAAKVNQAKDLLLA